jgi:aminotransferase
MQKISYISLMSNKVKAHGGINLAQGIPAFDPPAELLYELQKAAKNNVHQYAPGMGNADLLEQIKRHHQKDKKQLQKEEILIVNGATEAISLIYLYLFTQNKEKLSSCSISPSYESYTNLPRIFSQEHYEIQVKDISNGNLQQLIEKKNIKLLFISLPGNPMGSVLNENEIDILLSYSKKYKLHIIFDNVYEDFLFKKKRIPLLEKLNNYCFYVNSFSKIFSITGWRIGYFISSAENISKIADVHDYTGLSSPSVLQYALARYCEKTDFGREYVHGIQKKLAENYAFLSAALSKLGFKIAKAEGGYFIWCQLPNRFPNAKDFCMQIYEDQKIAMVPGIHFSPTATNYIRINIARKKEELQAALVGIEKFILIED